MDVIERDLPFYKASGGGLTLSGGEPFLQGEFAGELLRTAKAAGISTAVESCGYAPWENIEGALDSIEYLYFDIKHTDSGIHKDATGVDTGSIRENLRKIDAHDAAVTLVVRIPFIPGFNDGEESLRGIFQFAAGLSKLDHVEILPYHRLGTGKYEALGREYGLRHLLPVKNEELLRYIDIGREYGLEVTIEAK
jgi:pyruvate formate lyase activating enzyme